MNTFSSSTRTRGASLVELMATLLLLGILVSLSGPSVRGILIQVRVTRVLQQLRSDLHYARIRAVHSAERVEVRFTSSSNGCTEQYQIVVQSVPERVVKRVVVDDIGAGVCLTFNNGTNALVFNSRGLPRGGTARTFTVTLAGRTATLTLSQAGRLYMSD